MVLRSIEAHRDRLTGTSAGGSSRVADIFLRVESGLTQEFVLQE